jgi:tRNA-dihydrouridine synthase 1
MVAAMRCPTGACLVHCREMRAVESGMTPEEAHDQASRGGLVGTGCEAHEAKESARKDRRAEKRKIKTVWKEVAKQRKSDTRAKKQKGEQELPMMA